jgi:DNA polymerase III sliding clamp (beta) subunit (PCNA family)
MSLTLQKENLVIHRAASKEATRYDMSGIRIEKDATIATDGHILAVVGLPPQEEGSTFEPFTLSKNAAVSSEKQATDIVHTNGDGILHATKGITAVEKVNGHFPNWKAILSNSRGFQVGFDPNLLKTLCEIFIKAGHCEKTPVVMTFEKKENAQDYAIRFDMTTESGLPLTALLMPMRIPDEGVELKQWN